MNQAYVLWKYIAFISASVFFIFPSIIELKVLISPKFLCKYYFCYGMNLSLHLILSTAYFKWVTEFSYVERVTFSRFPCISFTEELRHNMPEVEKH